MFMTIKPRNDITSSNEAKNFLLQINCTWKNLLDSNPILLLCYKVGERLILIKQYKASALAKFSLQIKPPADSTSIKTLAHAGQIFNRQM